MSNGDGSAKSPAKEISDLMNEIIASLDYVPAAADLEWTRNALDYMRQNDTHWATPGAGCIILFDHEKMNFSVGMNGAPTMDELHNFARIRANLLLLGYRVDQKHVIPDTASTDDILRKAGNSQEQIREMNKHGAEKRKEIDDMGREEDQ